jgi:Aspartyl protease
VEFKNVVIDVEDRKPIADEVGLIGPHLLQQFLINLDLTNYSMSLDPLPSIPGDDGKPGPRDRYIAPEMASYAKVFQAQNHLLIPTKVGSDPKAVLFVIDTGASNNFIAQEYATKLEKLNEERNVTVTGVQGRAQQVLSADDLALQFAGFRQMNQKLIAQSLANLSAEVQLSGMLGLPVLRWFTLHIDYRDGLVGFEYHQPK